MYVMYDTRVLLFPIFWEKSKDTTKHNTTRKWYTTYMTYIPRISGDQQPLPVQGRSVHITTPKIQRREYTGY